MFLYIKLYINICALNYNMKHWLNILDMRYGHGYDMITYKNLLCEYQIQTYTFIPYKIFRIAHHK